MFGLGSMDEKLFMFHVNYSLTFLPFIRHLSFFFLGVRRDAQGPRNRGTRTEALSLLGQFFLFYYIITLS